VASSEWLRPGLGDGLLDCHRGGGGRGVLDSLERAPDTVDAEPSPVLGMALGDAVGQQDEALALSALAF
jgi:hypothetical protein